MPEAVAALADTPRPSHLRALWRIVLLLGWILFSVLAFLLFSLIRIIDPQAVARLFHRGVCRILGLQVEVRGAALAQGPMLFVGNHISYADIFVIGGRIPGFFIAKAEVGGWPLLGWLARFQNTLFFERRPGVARQQIAVMQAELRRGNKLIFFPEGTNSGGESVLPFKSTLFKAAELDTPVPVQPFTISYTRYAGQPMSSAQRSCYAWELPASFAPHFYRMLGLPGASAVLHVHEPVALADFSDRKALAAHCQGLVAATLADTLME